MRKKHWTMIVPGAVLLCASPAFGVELRDAVQAALSTNPEIRQAVANRLATQEERVQGQGLWYPRVSVEGSAGVRSLRNPTRRSIGIADQTLWPIEGQLIVNQLLYDSGGREAEIRRREDVSGVLVRRDRVVRARRFVVNRRDVDRQRVRRRIEIGAGRRAAVVAYLEGE
jgi:hypothetical protein